MQGLDERSWSLWSKHVDKQRVVCRVEAAEAESDKKEGGQEKSKGGYPGDEEDEEAYADQAKGEESELLPSFLEVQPEHEAGDDRRYASAKGPTRPDEVDLFVGNSNLWIRTHITGIVYLNEQVIDLGCQERLCGSQYAHGQAEADMASPGKGKIGGEPSRLPRAAHPPPPSPSPAASKSPATLLPASVQIGCSGALEFWVIRKVRDPQDLIFKTQDLWFQPLIEVLSLHCPPILNFPCAGIPESPKMYQPRQNHHIPQMNKNSSYVKKI